jgi:hypothetical protein
MVGEGFGIYPGRFERDENGNPVYITGANTQGWINVFALKRRDGKTYYRFGYNLSEGRWAYGDGPKIREEILRPYQSSQSSPASSSQGLRILSACLTGVWSVIVLLARAVIWICAGIAAIFIGLLAGGIKPRRRRRRRF